MTLLNKYKVLVNTAKSAGIDDLLVAEQDGVLQIKGTAPNADVKNKLWDVYNQIDPNFLSKEVLMNVYVSTLVSGTQAKVVTESTNLNVRKGPGTDQPIIGTAAKDEVITLISRTSGQWWLIRTTDGQEGYCYAQYLEIIG